jgi:iron complex outermembrane receptor protein
MSVESGLRTEWNKNKSAHTEDKGKVFVLPRINLLFKYGSKFTTRIGGGLGYRPLTIFNEEAEPYGYKGILPVDFAVAETERSYGLNADVNYQSYFGNNRMLTINHMFFYNQIHNPVVLSGTSTGLRFVNSQSHIESKGFETQVKYTIGKFTWFVGYTYTDAVFDNPGKNEFLVLVPKHSIKGDVLFVETGKWRIGADYEFKSRQRLSTERYTKNLFITGVVLERMIGKFVLFFNAENITDVRQSRYESLLSGPYHTTQFTEVWAPLDGRFLNFGLKVSL